MSKKRTRRKFTKEFKHKAVRLCGKKPVVEAAALGLDKWRQDAALQGSDAFRGNGNRSELEAELHRLRKENADLREEQEILKKASAYFAKHLK